MKRMTKRLATRCTQIADEVVPAWQAAWNGARRSFGYAAEAPRT